MARTKEERRQRTRRVQRGINKLSRKRGLDLRKVIVDGTKGPATNKAIRDAKWLLGFPRKACNKKITKEFIWQLEHPRRAKKPSNKWLEAEPGKAKRKYKWRKGRVRRGLKRRIKRRQWVASNQFRAFLKPGVGTFDGKPVAKVAIPQLRFARANGWRGVLVSGWRDPNYSERLCYNMCGAPSCSGRCAGKSSNHVGNSPARYSKDVSDYTKYGQLMARSDCPRPRVFNALGARDPVHYSPNGR
jgi:hypothetical protein